MKYASKNLFDFLKGLGQLKEFEDYEEFCEKKYGIGAEDAERKTEFNNWKESLDEKEKDDFNEAFGN